MLLVRHEERPKIIHHEQKARGQFGRSAGLRAKAAEAPLILEFVEHVLGVGPLPIELLDLPAIHLLRRIGEVDGELVLVLVPELRAVRGGHDPCSVRAKITRREVFQPVS